MKNRIDICDFHTHILPTTDHGSDSIETTVFQLKKASECGVSRIFATPHFYPHKESVESFLSRRNKSFLSLAPFIPDGIDIRLGAEVLFCGNIENIPSVMDLCFYGSNVMLMELPFAEFDTNGLSSIGALIDQGIEVIIAHAERYSEDIIDECIDYGAALQINASTISNGISSDKRILKWLDRGVVSSIGSDIHGKDKNAYKYFKKICKKIPLYIDKIRHKSNIIWDKTIPYSFDKI